MRPRHRTACRMRRRTSAKVMSMASGALRLLLPPALRVHAFPHHQQRAHLGPTRAVFPPCARRTARTVRAAGHSQTCMSRSVMPQARAPPSRSLADASQSQHPHRLIPPRLRPQSTEYRKPDRARVRAWVPDIRHRHIQQVVKRTLRTTCPYHR